jgi:hypothetical protein
LCKADGRPCRRTGSKAEETTSETAEKEVKPMVMIGRKAPDFVAPAYLEGKFVNVKLSEYLGKWVCSVLLPRGFHLCVSD